MNHHFSLIHLVYLCIAILFDVIANILLKFSNGFKKKLPAFTAIVFVLAAFTALSFAVKGIDLSVAYGIWGGLGLIATSMMSIILFQETIHPSGWLGILLVIGGTLLLKFAHFV